MKTNSRRFSLITILAVIIIACTTIFGIALRTEKSASTVFAAETYITIGDGTNGTTAPKQLSGYASSSYLRDVDYTLSPKTFEMVVKLNASSNLTDYSGAYGVVLGGFGSDVAAALEFNIEFAPSNYPRIYWGTTEQAGVASTGHFDWRTNYSISKETWQHIVFVIDDSSGSSTNLYLYVNGVQVATKTYSFDVVDMFLHESFYIGSDHRTGISGTGARGFQGAIKYVGLSADIKSADEIAESYNNSKAYGDQDDHEFRDPVCEEGGINTVLSFNTQRINPYAEYGYTGVDFSDVSNAYQLSEGITQNPRVFEALFKLNPQAARGTIIGGYKVNTANTSAGHFNIEVKDSLKPRFWYSPTSYGDSKEIDWEVNYVLPKNEWVHLVFIRNGTGGTGSVDCYVNGVLVDRNNASSGYTYGEKGAGTNFTSDTKHWIGRDSRTTYPFEGQINYVGISSATKTAAEVKTAYISATRLVKAADSTTIISEQPMRAVYKAEKIIEETINTVTATVNVPTYNTQRGVIFGTYGSFGPHRFNVEITAGNKIRIFYQTASSGATFDENIAGDYASILASGEDRHIVVTRMKRSGDWVAGNTGTGNYTKFAMWIYSTSGSLLGGPYYTNNSSEAETKYAETDIVSKALPTIGGDNRAQSVQYPFPGKIKMVAVYSGVMGETEAKSSASFAGSGTNITVTSNFGKTNGVLGHWELTDAQDDLIYNQTTRTSHATLADVSNNGNPMTIKSVAQYIEVGNDLIGTENNDADWFVADDDEYTFIYLPDTQVTVHWHADTITAMQNWIVNNADNMNLAMVMGLGDIQDGSPTVTAEPTGDGDYCFNTTEQWLKMQQFYTALDNKGILWSAVMGNHDYDTNSPNATNGRKAAKYNTYFGWEALNAMTKKTAASAIIARFSDGYLKDVKEEIKSDENQNVIYEFRAGGVDYLLVAFEFGPSDQMLEWASSVISNPKYANHRVLVNTHSMLYATGKFNYELTTDNPEFYGFKNTPGININNGQQMWDEFLSKHDNIFMAASGHIAYDEAMHRYDVGDNGNTVLSMLIDWQGTAYYNQAAYGVSGDGVIMVAKVNETNKTVTFRAFNPENNSFFMLENQFTYNFANNIGITKQVVVENDKLTADKTSGASGETVTVTVDTTNYSYWTPSVKTASGKVVSATKTNNTTFTFTMPADLERVYVNVEGISLAENISIRLEESRDLTQSIPTGYTITSSGTAINLNGNVITGIEAGEATLNIKNTSGTTCLTVTVTVVKEVLVAPSIVDKYLYSDKFKSHEVGARLRLMWTEHNSGIIFVGEMPTVLANAVQPKLLIVPQYYLDGIRSNTKNPQHEEAKKYLEAGDYITALEVAGLKYSIIENPYQIDNGEGTTLLMGGVKAIQDTNMNKAMFGIYFYEYYGTTYYAKLPEGLEQNVSRSMAWVVSGMVNDYATYTGTGDIPSTFNGTELDDHAKELTQKFLTRALKDSIVKTKAAELKKNDQTLSTNQANNDAKQWISDNIAPASLDFNSTPDDTITGRRKVGIVSFKDKDANYTLSATYFDTLPTYELKVWYITTEGEKGSLVVGNNLDFKPAIEVISAGEGYIEIDKFGNINVKGVTNGIVTDALKVNFAYQDKKNYELQTFAFDLEANADYVDLGVPAQYYEDGNNQPTKYKPNANVVIKPDGVKRLTAKTYMITPSYGTQTSTSGQITVSGTELVGNTTVVTGSLTDSFKIDSEENRVHILTVQHRSKSGATLAEDSIIEVPSSNNYIYNETATVINANPTAKTGVGELLQKVITAIAGGNNKLGKPFLPDHFWLEGQLSGDTTFTVTYSPYDVWDGTVANGFAGGDGTKDNPYIIASAAQLAYLSKITYKDSSVQESFCAGDYFELATSIDLAGRIWTPIAFEKNDYAWNWFQGELNGNGYTITGLNAGADGKYINWTTGAEASGRAFGYGLFGGIGTGGVVKNLSLNGSLTPTHRAGAVCYYLGNNARVENVKNFASVTVAKAGDYGAYVGGIAGTASGGGSIIDNCYNYGTITAQGSHVGGIVGSLQGNNASINNSNNYGTITGGYCVGGIVGTLTQSADNCKNYGEVKVTTAISSIKVKSANFQVTETETKVKKDLNILFERYGTAFGGIIGNAGGGYAIDCENWANVTGATDCTHAWEFEDTSLDESEYKLSDYPTNRGVGGIIGYNSRGGIDNAVNYGNVTGCLEHTDDLIGAALEYFNEQVMLTVRFYDDQGNLYGYKNLAVPTGIKYDGRRNDGDHDFAITSTSETKYNNDGSSYVETTQVRGSMEELIAYVNEEYNYAHGGHFLPDIFWWSGFINEDTTINITFTEADVWDGTVANGFAGGSGTEADPYLISTGAQLAYLSKLSYGNSYGSGQYFKLINSIDLNNIEWTPIGWNDESRYYGQNSTTSGFRGYFDGNGYTIAGLKVSNLYGNTSQVGLFGYFRNNTLKDLIVQGNVVGSHRVGGVAFRFHASTVDNVISYVDVVATGEGEGKYANGAYTKADEDAETAAREKYAYAGAFAGYVAGATVITNSVSYGSATTTNGVIRVGAAIGYFKDSTIVNFVNYGNVNASTHYVGGVMGNAEKSRVYNCINYGNVTCTANHVGGIVGETIVYTTVYGCVNYGDITGEDSVGGCLGYVGPGCSYAECKNEGTVVGTAEKVGSIVGWDKGDTDGQTTTINSVVTDYYVITVNYFYEDGRVAHAPKIIAVKEGYFGKDTQKLGVTDEKGNPIIETADNLLSPEIEGYLPDMFWVSGWADEDKIFNITYSEADTWDGSIASSFAGGNGTKYNPYLIETAEQLALMSDFYSNPTGNYGGNVYFKLVKSIDLNCKELEKEWTPIGWKNSSNEATIASAAFEGYFDGNGKTIAGIYRNSGAGLGLFQTFSGVATNLTIEGNITGNSHLGGFAAMLGTAGKAGRIDGIKSFINLSNNKSSYWWYAGGVVGKTQSSYVNNCHNYGDINAVAIRLGGVVAGATGPCQITNCNNYGIITCDNRTESANAYANGGIVGIAENVATATHLVIDNCINYADINSNYNTTGGIVGQTQRLVNVTNVKNYGDITAHTFIGGVVGEMLQANGYINTKVSYAYNYGNITSNGVMGGVIGRALTGSADHIYNYGNVTTNATTTATGGLVGQLLLSETSGQDTAFTFTLTDSTNEGAVTGTTLIAGVIGYTTNPVALTNCVNSGSINGTGQSVAGIIGNIGASSSLEGCSNSGTITTNNAYCGGLVGHAFATTNISNCSNSGDVYGTTDVGGFVGYYSGGDLIGGTNTGTVKGDGFVGGIAGRFSEVMASDVTNTGAIGMRNSAGNYIGGISGQITNLSVIENVTNEGTVSGLSNIGGISGYIGAGSELKDSVNESTGIITGNESLGGIVAYSGGGFVVGCDNKASVTSTGGTGEYIGGIIGNNSNQWSPEINTFSNAVVMDCTNTGAISGTNYIGGIWGNVYAADIVSCTNSGRVTATGDAAGGIGGHVTDASVIQNSTNSGAVTAKTRAGGIAGYLGDLVYASINKSYEVGNVVYYAINPRVGYSSEIIDCSNSGSVTATNGSSGNIAAQNKGGIYTMDANGILTVVELKATKGWDVHNNGKIDDIDVDGDGVTEESEKEIAKGTYTVVDENGVSTGETVSIEVQLRKDRPEIYNPRYRGLLSTLEKGYNSIWTGEENSQSETKTISRTGKNGDGSSEVYTGTANVVVTAKKVSNVYLYGEKVSGVAFKVVINHDLAPHMDLGRYAGETPSSWKPETDWAEYLNVELKSYGNGQYFANSYYKHRSYLGVQMHYTFVKNTSGDYAYTSTFEMFIPYNKLYNADSVQGTLNSSSEIRFIVYYCAEVNWTTFMNSTLFYVTEDGIYTPQQYAALNPA